MTTDIAQYVRNCLSYKRTKAYRDGKHRLLHPLPIPERYWQSISVDFIVSLPPCRYRGRTYRHIMVIVDRLSKKKKFIALEDLRTETAVLGFLEYVWREEGYPESIVSDRGKQFVSHFWKRLCQRLGTTPKLSTAYHPETDGQTENANGYLKQYLRAYVTYDQDDWVRHLPTAEFEANDTVSATTGVSPFVATKGYPPKSGHEPPLPLPPGLPTPARLDIEKVDRFIVNIDKLRQFLRMNMRWAQAKQADYANASRQPAPAFKVGDRVLVDARYIHTTRPSRSLDLQNRGPFEIVEVIDNMAYRLRLPKQLQGIHDVFHPWLLHLYDDNPLAGQDQPVEEPCEVVPPEDETEYTVEQILDSQIDSAQRDPSRRGRPKGLLRYLVKWKDYPESDDNPSWEPHMYVTDGAKELINRFHDKQPDKPGPIEKMDKERDGSRRVRQR